MRILTVMLVLTMLIGCPPCLLAKTDQQFMRWLANFSAQAERQGISRATIQRAFAGLTAPNRSVLKKARYQPEFTMTIRDYLEPRVNRSIAAKGRIMAVRYGKTLADIERQTGVSRYILLAIWSMESSYGAVLKQKSRFYPVPHALATLAYADKKRSKFGRTQLMAALKILEAGDISPEAMLGSWAGAMGHTQFIPTSYLAYGVDWDQDGRRDIWNSIPDALATAANLLKKNNWQTGKTWGYEVVSPAGGHRFAGQTKTLGQWSALGFKRPNASPFPRSEERAELKFIAGSKGPAYLMTKNFFVIKRYNNSDFYALAVGQLADLIAGSSMSGSSMVQKWPQRAGSLSFTEKQELQLLMKRAGVYTGKTDGIIGNDSRAGIIRLQERYGLPVNGRADKKLLLLLRKKIASR
ncbi:MAG: lytic transglycosylase [Deltaproteobacteria bacterium]|nr:MAG: lytic transglycosylase [Deltaproteobacteria bacterium]